MSMQENLPNERRAAVVSVCGATVGGTTNTNVVAFTGAPAVCQGTVYPLGTTHVAPVAGSGNWINIVNDAAFGTTFKFNRRGIYKARISADNTVASVVAAQLAITLDQQVALYTVAAGTVTPATAGFGTTVLDYTNIDSLADAAVPGHVDADVYITDALAGGAQAAAAAGVQGVGVLRFLANDTANGVVAAAFIVTTYRAFITQISGDLAG